MCWQPRVGAACLQLRREAATCLQPRVEAAAWLAQAEAACLQPQGQAVLREGAGCVHLMEVQLHGCDPWGPQRCPHGVVPSA